MTSTMGATREDTIKESKKVRQEREKKQEGLHANCSKKKSRILFPRRRVFGRTERQAHGRSGTQRKGRTKSASAAMAAADRNKGRRGTTTRRMPSTTERKTGSTKTSTRKKKAENNRALACTPLPVKNDRVQARLTMKKKKKRTQQSHRKDCCMGGG